MIQTSLFVERDPIFEAVRALIGSYVKRGDKLEWLKDMGASSPQSYNVSIGGYLGSKRYGNDKILVARDIDGKTVNAVLSKKEAYDKLLAEIN